MVSPESPPESVAQKLAAGPDDGTHSHPKVFVSYSHESNEHRERVLGLAERLPADGFDTVIDRHIEGTPPPGLASLDAQPDRLDRLHPPRLHRDVLPAFPRT